MSKSKKIPMCNPPIESYFEEILGYKKNKEYGKALETIKLTKQVFFNGQNFNYSYKDKDNNWHYLIEMQNEMQGILLNKKRKKSWFRNIVLAVVGAAMLFGAFDLGYKMGVGSVKKNDKSRISVEYSSVSESKNTVKAEKQNQGIEEYKMQKGDCAWTVLRKKFPEKSNADLVKLINGELSRLNNKTTNYDYDNYDSNNMHYWQIGETMYIPVSK